MHNSYDQMLEFLDNQSKDILGLNEQSKVQGSYEIMENYNVIRESSTIHRVICWRVHLLQKLRLRIKGLTKWKRLWIQMSLSQFYPFSLYFHMSSMMLEERLLCCNHKSSWRIGATIRVKILILQPFKFRGRIFFNRGWRVIFFFDK